MVRARSGLYAGYGNNSKVVLMNDCVQFPQTDPSPPEVGDNLSVDFQGLGAVG